MQAHTEEALRGRLEQEPDVLVAYLFGSQTRGTSGPLSDIDVAVLLRDGAGLRSRHLELIDAVASVVGSERADVVLLNEAPVSLAYRVLRDNRLLFCRDERARIHHWVTTVDRYIDMEPMRHLFTEGTRHRIAEGKFGRR